MTTDERRFHTIFGNQKAAHCLEHTSAKSFLVGYSKGSGNLDRQRKTNSVGTKKMLEIVNFLEKPSMLSFLKDN